MAPTREEVLDGVSNAEFIKAWLDDLRSGKFHQVPNTLRDGENGRCCLGAAIDTLFRVSPVVEDCLYLGDYNTYYSSSSEGLEEDYQDPESIWRDRGQFGLEADEWPEWFARFFDLAYDDHQTFDEDGNMLYPTEERLDKLGTREFFRTHPHQGALAVMNDAGIPWEEIADIIEAEVLPNVS